MKSHRLAVACLALSLASGSAALAGQPSWIGVWGFAPTSPLPPPTLPTAPAPVAAAGGKTITTPTRRDPAGPETVANATIRQVVQVSAAGKQVRLRLTNEFGPAPMVIGKAMIAPLGADGAAGAGRPVTFGGQAGATIQPGAPLLSDPVDLPVAAMQKLAVSLHLPQETRLPYHLVRQTLSEGGDFTAASRLNDTPLRLGAIVTGVQVVRDAPKRVIVTLGDSITEGAGSTPGAFHAWPDILAQRLAGRVAVVNVGVGGNRLLRERSGPSALARFDRDVLAVPGVTDVILLEGINDITRQFNPQYGEPASAADLIAGYEQLIVRAHARGLKIYGATITPFGGSPAYTRPGEAIRLAANAWIRDSGKFDGVIDFEAAVRDPANPSALRPEYQSGDWLHPSDAGYQAMAAAIDLSRIGRE